jgi:hypothetical protein
VQSKNKNTANILKFGCVLLGLFSLATGYLSQSGGESSTAEEKKSYGEFSIAHSKSQKCNQLTLNPFATGIGCEVKQLSEDFENDQDELNHANELQKSMYASLPRRLIENSSKGDENSVVMYVSYSILCKLEGMHLPDASDLCIFGKYELYDSEFKSRLGYLANSGSEFAKMQLLKWDSIKQSLRDSPESGQVEESPQI